VTFWTRRLITLLSSVVMLVALASPALADSTRVCNNRCGEVDQSTTNNIDNSQDNDTTINDNDTTNIDNSQDNDTTINDNDTTNVDNNTTNNIDNSVENNTTNNTTNNIENTTNNCSVKDACKFE
jgi:hypothetical protein